MENKGVINNGERIIETIRSFFGNDAEIEAQRLVLRNKRGKE